MRTETDGWIAKLQQLPMRHRWLRWAVLGLSLSELREAVAETSCASGGADPV